MGRIKDSVKMAAEWLDSECEGWEHKIDLDDLDQINTSTCILGQLEYFEGKLFFLTEIEELSLDEEAQLAFGSRRFCGFANRRRWYKLNKAWRKAINRRRKLEKK